MHVILTSKSTYGQSTLTFKTSPHRRQIPLSIKISVKNKKLDAIIKVKKKMKICTKIILSPIFLTVAHLCFKPFFHPYTYFLTLFFYYTLSLNTVPFFCMNQNLKPRTKKIKNGMLCLFALKQIHFQPQSHHHTNKRCVFDYQQPTTYFEVSQ